MHFTGDNIQLYEDYDPEWPPSLEFLALRKMRFDDVNIVLFGLGDAAQRLERDGTPMRLHTLEVTSSYTYADSLTYVSF